MTEFAKKGLIHASNFSNSRLCNSACAGSIALKFGSWTVLSLHLYDSNVWPNSLLINEIVPLQSHNIGCLYKTPFANSVTFVNWSAITDHVWPMDSYKWISVESRLSLCVSKFIV